MKVAFPIWWENSAPWLYCCWVRGTSRISGGKYHYRIRTLIGRSHLSWNKSATRDLSHCQPRHWYRWALNCEWVKSISSTLHRQSRDCWGYPLLEREIRRNSCVLWKNGICAGEFAWASRTCFQFGNYKMGTCPTDNRTMAPGIRYLAPAIPDPTCCCMFVSVICFCFDR